MVQLNNSVSLDTFAVYGFGGNLLRLFNELMGDLFSALVLAIAAHTVGGMMVKYTDSSRINVHTYGQFVGLLSFILLCLLEFTGRGPQWLNIVILCALRGWFVCGATWIVLSLVILSLGRVFGALSRYRKQRATPKVLALPPPSLIDQTRNQFERIEPAPQIEPPCQPILQEKAQALIERANEFDQIIDTMPIADDEKEARKVFVSKRLGEQLNRLMEEEW